MPLKSMTARVSSNITTYLAPADARILRRWNWILTHRGDFGAFTIAITIGIVVFVGLVIIVGKHLKRSVLRMRQRMLSGTPDRTERQLEGGTFTLPQRAPVTVPSIALLTLSREATSEQAEGEFGGSVTTLPRYTPIARPPIVLLPLLREAPLSREEQELFRDFDGVWFSPNAGEAVEIAEIPEVHREEYGNLPPENLEANRGTQLNCVVPRIRLSEERTTDWVQGQSIARPYTDRRPPRYEARD